MLDLNNLVRKKKSEILDLAAKYDAHNIRIFGSVARGDFHENSDIDFLVDFGPDVGLLEWCGLRLDLKDLLGREIDIATEKSLKSRLKEKVLNEAIPL